MAYERNWAFSFNNVYVPLVNNILDYNRIHLWMLKAMLLGQYGGFTQGLWTVYSSCDSVNFGNGDGVDWWGGTYNPTKLVRAAAPAAHSWIVLKSPLMNGYNFYITMAMKGTQDYYLNVSFSKVAPSGGLTTARPTASDEWVTLATNGTWASNFSGSYTLNFNMCLSDTGDFFWIPYQQAYRNFTLSFAVVAPVGCHASDLYPIWTFLSSVTGAWQANNLQSAVHTATLGGVATDRVGYSTCSMLGFTPHNAPFGLPDCLTGKYLTLPYVVSVVGAAPSGYWHQRGRLPDVFVAPYGNGGALPLGAVIRDAGGNITHFSPMGSIFLPGNSCPLFE